MLSLLLLVFGFVHSQTTLPCDDGWTDFEGYCYKHFDTPNDRLLLEGIRAKCATFGPGGDIATAAKRSERQLMETLNRPSFNGNFFYYEPFGEQMLVGIIQRPDGHWESVNASESIDQPWQWCGANVNQREPNQWLGIEHCTMHHSYASDPFCYHDIECGGHGGLYGYRRYICKMPKKTLVCTNKDTVIKDGKCVCKEGYEDIRESDALDRKKYKEGEKCVPKDPCRSLKRSLAMIFIIDASQSIREKNWPSLVSFLKSGARLIPNKVNVGFVKFSTNVTFADWLPVKWSTREFQQTVPTDFDAGYTNTPAAIEKVIEMFDEDSSREQVAVLITDGLPVVNEETDKEKGLSDTRKAISRLQRKGVDLVALGFGPELQKQQGYTYIKKWLEDPREDYFSFEKEACDLRSVHMQILLQKVCRRYV